MNNETLTQLQYTGHPLVDVGIATIVAFADKDSPDELTEADLEAIADYMTQNYNVNPMRSYLTVAFMNADGFTQPAYFKNPEAQQQYANLVLRAYGEDVPTRQERDPFLGLPVVDISLNVKGATEPGRAFRQHIPLQTGVDVINFYPYGDAGLPISGLALLTIHAFPLGSAKCYGSPLLIHSDNQEIMLSFARKFLDHNRRAINLAQQAGSNKLGELPKRRATLIIETLLEALSKQERSEKKNQPFSITALHINSGKTPSLDIYHLPSQIVSYLQLMLSPDYQVAWEQIVRRAWIKPKLKRGQTEAPADFQPDRNYLYEDLFSLAGNVANRAPRFIRTYFLRDAYRYARQDETDPRRDYNAQEEVGLVSWKVTEPFLRRIMHMEPERIEEIKALGDALAEYIKSENDRSFFRSFYAVKRYDFLRNALIKANTAHVKRGNAPFLTFENYISVFEVGEAVAFKDWKLARDLVLIRLVEKLHANEWLGGNMDAIPEVSQEQEDESQS